MRRLWTASWLLLLATVATPATAAPVSVNLPLDHWAYATVERLYALGVVDTTLLGPRPWDRTTFARLTQAAEEHQPTGVAARQVRRLAREFSPELNELEGAAGRSYVKPVESLGLRTLATSGEPEALLAHGDTLSDGIDLRLDWQLHARLGSHLALFARPEARWSSGDTLPFRRRGIGATPAPVDESDPRIILRESYAKLRLWNLELEGGRDHLGWGPGRRGSLLLTDNAEPLDLIKLTNPDPVLLPWFLRLLGPVQATWFWSELEHNRAVHRAQLTGLRIDFKPTPNWEVGLARVIQFGGAGRPGLLDKGLRDLVSGINAEGADDPDTENSLAAIDLVWRITWPRPAVLYWEYGGEDQQTLLDILPFMSAFGHVAGIYLPQPIPAVPLDVRFEYFNNIQSSRPLWYGHHIYRSGYTYRGKILGHPFGGDAEAWSLRLDLFPTDRLQLGFDLDLVRNGRVGVATREKELRSGLDALLFTDGPLRCHARYDFEHRTDANGTPGNDQTNHRIELGVTLDL